MKTLAIALSSGTIFGAGLALSGMTNPAKVQNFLDIAGSWDPSLAFVMGAALLVTAIATRISTLRLSEGARAARAVQAPIDARLLGGSALFGIGWGAAGFCPGPALASLWTASPQVLTFVVAMLVGMAAFRRIAATPTGALDAPGPTPGEPSQPSVYSKVPCAPSPNPIDSH
jgi:uncharacterized membrane protein YedE/YeeE